MTESQGESVVLTQWHIKQPILNFSPYSLSFAAIRCLSISSEKIQQPTQLYYGKRKGAHQHCCHRPCRLWEINHHWTLDLQAWRY
ncbi:hypothetical protein L1887_09531 [Cichorium endivia]|nr:hypothetical protein L1887_09531 [Cichorium endivia]